jgi:hypothetical protein
MRALLIGPQTIPITDNLLRLSSLPGCLTWRPGVPSRPTSLRRQPKQPFSFFLGELNRFAVIRVTG